MKKLLLGAPAFVMLWSATILNAQTAPTAPLPAQLLSAKAVFLANARSNIPLPDTFITQAYNTMYHELATTNRFQMAVAPAAADLSCEFSVKISPGPVVSGDSSGSAYVELVIRDAKSQALLWTISEPIKGFAIREKTVIKIIDQATVRLAADFATLTSTSSTAVAPTAALPQP